MTNQSEYTNKEEHSALEEAVKILKPLVAACYDLEQTKPKVEATIDATLRSIVNLVKSRESALLSRVREEVIGEDEEGWWSDTRVAITERGTTWFAEWAAVVVENKLRATQRTKLDQLSKEI